LILLEKGAETSFDKLGGLTHSPPPMSFMSLAAASTALNISITLLVIVHVVVSLFMILVVMMQRPKQEGLGAAFGGGMTDQLLGAGTTSFLQKATVVLGVLFFLISLILAILIGRSNKQQGLDTEQVVPKEQSAAPAVPGDVTMPESSAEDSESEELLKALEQGLDEANQEAANEGLTESGEIEEATPDNSSEETPEMEGESNSADAVESSEEESSEDDSSENAPQQ
jgi:preprotein translocase subunit SecG